MSDISDLAESEFIHLITAVKDDSLLIGFWIDRAMIKAVFPYERLSTIALEKISKASFVTFEHYENINAVKGELKTINNIKSVRFYNRKDEPKELIFTYNNPHYLELKLMHFG